MVIQTRQSAPAAVCGHGAARVRRAAAPCRPV